MAQVRILEDLVVDVDHRSHIGQDLRDADEGVPAIGVSERLLASGLDAVVNLFADPLGQP